MPNISMIEKVVPEVCAIDYLVSKNTLLVNKFIQRQNFLIDEDISQMGLLSSSKECITDLFWAEHRFFKISLIGRGPDIDTVR